MRMKHPYTSYKFNIVMVDYIQTFNKYLPDFLVSIDMSINYTKPKLQKSEKQ